MSEKVTEFPNLGPKSAKMLAAANITSEQQIRELGPVLTYLAVSQAGQRPALNLLWAIAAGIQNRHWTDLSAAEKDQLRKQVRQLTR
jgi:hypothetical protein